MRLWASASVKQLTAAFDAAYTLALGTGAKPPSPDDVFTIRPGSPDSIIRGTNAAQPLAVPNTLTPKHQRKSLSSCSHGLPPPPLVTPGVVEQQVTSPVCLEHRIGQRAERCVVADVGPDTGHVTSIGELGHRGIEHWFLDVGDDHPDAVVEQCLDDRPTDAVGTAGHHGHASGEVGEVGLRAGVAH